MSSPVLTIANQLTLLRMGLAPVVVVLVLDRQFAWALVVFVVAAVTDLLDGLIARLGHQQTSLGVMLDPVADKILRSSAFVALTWGNGLVQAAPAWLTVIVLSRDAIMLVSVAIINLTLGRRLFHPTAVGKAATGAQLLTVGVTLLANALGQPLAAARWLFLLTLALTVASALHYVHVASTGRPGGGEP